VPTAFWEDAIDLDGPPRASHIICTIKKGLPSAESKIHSTRKKNFNQVLVSVDISLFS